MYILYICKNDECSPVFQQIIKYIPQVDHKFKYLCAQNCLIVLLSAFARSLLWQLRDKISLQTHMYVFTLKLAMETPVKGNTLEQV